MIRFKLEDENNNYKSYSIEIDFEDGEDFDDWTYDNKDFEDFMEQMETGHNNWNGVHDGSGGIDDDGVEYVSFSSYEIQDFNTAIKLWEDFFRKVNKLNN
jgi:hypothetical protein